MNKHYSTQTHFLYLYHSHFDRLNKSAFQITQTNETYYFVEKKSLHFVTASHIMDKTLVILFFAVLFGNLFLK